MLAAFAPTVALVLLACGGHAAPAPVLGNTTAHAAGGARTVRDIDWLNRTYVGEMSSYPVKDGQYEYTLDEHGTIVGPDYQPTDPDALLEHGWFSVSPPVFGDVNGDGIDDAIVVSIENTGGTGQFSGIDVYTLRDGEPVVLGGIPGGDRGDGGISDVRIDGAVVVVDRLRSVEGDGACCPSQVQTERWRWDGGRFVEDESARTFGSFGG